MANFHRKFNRMTTEELRIEAARLRKAAGDAPNASGSDAWARWSREWQDAVSEIERREAAENAEAVERALPAIIEEEGKNG